MDYAIRNYNLNDAKIEPVLQLAKMIGMESELQFIRQNKEKVFPILSGIVVYRQLDSKNKVRVLSGAQNLGSPRFFGKVQTLVGLMIVQPAWNPWCLSDLELRRFFENNKSVSDFLGTWFITIDGKIEVGFLAAAVYQISSEGGKAFISNLTGKPIAEAALAKLNLSKNAVRSGGNAFFVLVILASVLKNFSDSDVKAAKKELLNRGLLRQGDLL